MTAIRQKLPYFLLVLIHSATVLTQSEEPESQNAETIFAEREWTSADGSQTFTGNLTKLENGQVTIEKEGEPLTFSVERLSPADNEFLGQGITVTTDDGKTYENASVSKITASSVTLSLESGIATVRMDQLPEAMRQRFGYDPDTGAKELEAQAKARAARQAQMAALQQRENMEAERKKELERAEKETFKVFQTVPNQGFLANEYTRGGLAGSAARALGGSSFVAPVVGDVVFLTGALDDGIVDGTILDAMVVLDGTFQYETTLGATKTVKKYKVLEMKADETN